MIEDRYNAGIALLRIAKNYQQARPDLSDNGENTLFGLSVGTGGLAARPRGHPKRTLRKLLLMELLAYQSATGRHAPSPASVSPLLVPNSQAKRYQPNRYFPRPTPSRCATGPWRRFCPLQELQTLLLSRQVPIDFVFSRL